MQMLVLAGPARVGKTTIAKKIAEFAFNRGLRPCLLSFAGVLKDEANKAGLCKEKTPDEYREYCQRVGKKKRQENPDHWLGKFHDMILEILDKETELVQADKEFWEHIIIVDDCRYMNEVGYAKKHNATLIFVDNGSRELPEADAKYRKHESESLAHKVSSGHKDYQDIFPWIIRNQGSLAQLDKKLKIVMPLWCGMSPTIHYSKCECELCSARRQDRPPDIEKLVDQMLELMFKEYEEDEEDEET
jgi:hypothetical protein